MERQENFKGIKFYSGSNICQEGNITPKKNGNKLSCFEWKWQKKLIGTWKTHDDVCLEKREKQQMTTFAHRSTISS
jgi:hypothetical protein